MDPHPPTADVREPIRTVLARISAAWRLRRYEELSGYLDEHIVLVAPGFQGRLEGRGAVVQSYRDFMERGSISLYQESPPTIDVWGDTAVASYHWEMIWDAANAPKGTPNHQAGHDIFVLRRDGAGEWRAVWRTLTVEHQER